MEHELAKKFKNVKLNFYKSIDNGRIEELNMQMPQGKIDFLFKAENSLLISKYYKKECEELFATDEEKSAELSNQKCLISF